MTSQEEQMLNSLVERVNATQLSEKDPDAAGLLQRGFSSNGDAVYILAQSVLVQNIALEQARAQLADAKDQLAQAQQHPAKATSFLGSLLGHKDQTPPPPAPQQQPQYQPVYTPQAQPEYQTPYNPGPGYAPGYAPPYQGQPYGGPQYVAAPPMGMGGGPFAQGSFLRGAAQTAAGVAAGALAFEGVESLLHGGFGHPGFGMGMGGYGMGGGWGMPGMGMGMGMGYERPIEETVVNNYYDSPGVGEYREHESGGEHHFQESSGDGNTQYSDAGWNDNSGSGNDSGSDYDSSGDFGSNDSGGDSGGF